MSRYEHLLEDFEDAYFALLMDKVAKQEGERLEQLNQELIADPNFELPETTDQKCLRTIERCFAHQQRRTVLRSIPVFYILPQSLLRFLFSFLPRHLPYRRIFGLRPEICLSRLMNDIRTSECKVKIPMEIPARPVFQVNLSMVWVPIPTLTTSLWDGYQKGFNLLEVDTITGFTMKMMTVIGYISL